MKLRIKAETLIRHGRDRHDLRERWDEGQVRSRLWWMVGHSDPRKLGLFRELVSCCCFQSWKKKILCGRLFTRESVAPSSSIVCSGQAFCVGAVSASRHFFVRSPKTTKQTQSDSFFFHSRHDASVCLSRISILASLSAPPSAFYFPFILILHLIHGSSAWSSHAEMMMMMITVSSFICADSSRWLWIHLLAQVKTWDESEESAHLTDLLRGIFHGRIVDMASMAWPSHHTEDVTWADASAHFTDRPLMFVFHFGSRLSRQNPTSS